MFSPYMGSVSSAVSCWKVSVKPREVSSFTGAGASRAAAGAAPRPAGSSASVSAAAADTMVRPRR